MTPPRAEVAAPSPGGAAPPLPGEPAQDEAPPDAPASRLDRIAAAWPRVDPALYAIYAGACVIYAAVAFYGAMHAQTGGVWSAPLDDVFIHFDYARATARGYPFQWSEGNGFSSGNTSLTYPFVLALGYLVGFRGLWLMQWAALVACASVLGFLLLGGRLLERVGRWAKYLLPPVALSIGALDWSLFSGMENAFHLGVWALSAAASLELVEAADRGDPPAALARRGWIAGVAGALLYATRPESVICVVTFGALAALAVRRARGGRRAIGALLRVGVPGVIAVIAQAAANRALTGEWAANGAIAKLALNNPYLTAGEKWENYLFLLKYVVVRNTEHHFADAPPWGWVVPVVAALPLAPRATRGVAAILWVQVVGWLALVALNGQVRWQNERYTMPAVAWLLVLAAMGLAVLARGRWTQAAPAARAGRAAPAARAASTPRARALHGARIALAVGIAALFWRHQLPNMRDQIWFFARASRNIRDQHLVAGRLLGELGVRRILVGDAGALLYAADRPGLDLIGLGGYHDLPFARAGVHGLGASLELVERIPPADRPDVMAIYPTWWGNLPAIFGEQLLTVPVVGNVICGGAEKVVYRADWGPLERLSAPASLLPGERVADEVDVADLVSEQAHGYAFPRPQKGFVEYNVLPHPREPGRELFDAGRVIPAGSRETARVRAPRGPGRLIVRTAASHPAVVEARADNRPLGRLSIHHGRGWAEAALDLPADLPATFELSLIAVEGGWSDHHVWILEPADAGAAAPLGSHVEAAPSPPGQAPGRPAGD